LNDYLKKYCTNLKINLVYTNNKHTVLSSTIQNGIPTLRVHNIFKSCPENIAKALIDYYTNFQENNSLLLIIENYIKEKLNSVQYKITPPNNHFKELFNKAVISPKANSSDKLSLIEYEITSITQKDLFGNISNITPDETIKPTLDNVLELTIVVSSTKQ